MEAFNKENPQTSFGAFKPVGNIVIVFPEQAKAEQAQEDLITGGHDQDNIVLMQAGEFVEMLDEIAETRSDLALLGSEMAKSDDFREQAEKGASFLIVPASAQEEVERVLNVAERSDYVFAEKYGTMVIEHFEPEH